jgi:hypothetical protein
MTPLCCPIGHAAGTASVVAHDGWTLAAWSSSLPSGLRITRVFSCVARGLKACPIFIFAGCWWRPLLAVDGRSGASRGHASVVRRPGSRWSGGVGSRSPRWLPCWLPVTASSIRLIATANALQGISNADTEGLVSRMLASRDRRPRGHPASGLLDRALCRSAGTFRSWEAGRRADEPIDPERNHADPGSTSTCAGGRGPARLLPPRLPALPSPAPPYGDNECRKA